MTLIRSISCIRGTIGGRPAEALTPPDIVLFVSAYVQLVREMTGKGRLRIVTDRDLRISGSMVSQLVTGTLQGCGADVIDLGLSTTPTVEMAVSNLQADGGIILTASHNPQQWNALKLLNGKGEFLSAADGEALLEIAARGDISYAEVDRLGSYTRVDDQLDKHIDAILKLHAVDVGAISEKKLRVGVDAINSSGAIALPALLNRLGVIEVLGINMEPHGRFAHNPEPLPVNLQDICRLVRDKRLDLAFVVDPDVDRLAIVMEDGELFGEEYTLVAVADGVEPLFDQGAERCDGKAWVTILCLCSGRCECGRKDEGGQGRHRRGGQRRGYLSGLALWPGCPGRHCAFPYLARNVRYDLQPAQKNLSRLFHLQEQDRAQAGH